MCNFHLLDLHGISSIIDIAFTTHTLYNRRANVCVQIYANIISSIVVKQTYRMDDSIFLLKKLSSPWMRETMSASNLEPFDKPTLSRQFFFMFLDWYAFPTSFLLHEFFLLILLVANYRCWIDFTCSEEGGSDKISGSALFSSFIFTSITSSLEMMSYSL